MLLVAVLVSAVAISIWAQPPATRTPTFSLRLSVGADTPFKDSFQPVLPQTSTDPMGQMEPGRVESPAETRHEAPVVSDVTDGRTRTADRRFLGEYGQFGRPSSPYTFEALKKGMHAAEDLFSSGSRYWVGGGVVGPTEKQVQRRYDELFRLVLFRLDHAKFKLSEVRSNECVCRPEHFYSSPPAKRRKRHFEPPETLSYQFMRHALDVLREEGRVIPPDCAVTLPPGYLASCLTYAFSTMRGRDLSLFFSNDTSEKQPSIFTDLRRFRDSQCARLIPCALWTSGEIGPSPSNSTSAAPPEENEGIAAYQNFWRSTPVFSDAVSSVLGHFGAHVANLLEVDQLMSLKKSIFYHTRHSDIAPLLVSHRMLDRAPFGDLPLYVSVDSETELLSIGLSSKALANETLTFPQMSSEAVYTILRMVGSPESQPSSRSHVPDVSRIFPRLIAFFGDSVERATYFAIVSALRRGPEYVRSQSPQGKSWWQYAAWSTSAMYDGRILHVVFKDCDTLLSTIVYPFMEDANGNVPMHRSVREAIEDVVVKIIESNRIAFAKGEPLPFGARDIITSVLSPIRLGPSQLLQMGTLRWYIRLLKRLCLNDPSPTKELCPRLLTYYVFDMSANVQNVELMHEQGGDMFMDLIKERSCGGKRVANSFIQSQQDPLTPPTAGGRSAHAVTWDVSARDEISVGLVSLSFGFWEQPEPSLIDRLHAFYTPEFNALLSSNHHSSHDTLFLQRLSTIYHHQKGRSRPYYEAFRHAFQTESKSVFENATIVRSDFDEHTRSSAWTRMRTDFTFPSQYSNRMTPGAFVGTSAGEQLPGLVMGYGGRKGWKLVPEQDTVLEPERRTREAIPFPKRDKVINPSRMRVQVERMLVECWAAMMHLSALMLDLTYNVLNIGPLPEVPGTVVRSAAFASSSETLPISRRHLPDALNPTSMDPVAQSRELFDQFRYTGDSGGLILQYTNAHRSNIYRAEQQSLMDVCPIGLANRSLYISLNGSLARSGVRPPILWAFDASLVQTLYPFTGTDIVHTDCHFSLNARRPERTSGAGSENHVLMADWGFSALFTSLHPDATENGYEEGVASVHAPPHKTRRSWSTIQPVCVDDNGTEGGDDAVGGRKQDVVFSVDVSMALERKFYGFLFHRFGCEANWTLDTEYRMLPTRRSLLDNTIFPRAPPECSLMVGQTLSQCRNVLSENENYLRLLHILRARSSVIN